MRKLTISAVALSLVSLAGCSTAEWRMTKAECEREWTQKIPPDERVVKETGWERVKPAAGTSECRPTATGTVCVHGPNEGSLPYTYYSSYDANYDRREVAINTCTQSQCQKRYGNASCDPPKPASQKPSSPT